MPSMSTTAIGKPGFNWQNSQVCFHFLNLDPVLLGLWPSSSTRIPGLCRRTSPMYLLWMNFESSRINDRKDV